MFGIGIGVSRPPFNVSKLQEFSPSDLANLVGWWRGDSGIVQDVLNNVQSWNDLSSHGFNLTQPSAVNRPAYVANGGLGYANCPANTFGMLNDVFTQLAKPFEMFAVVRSAYVSGNAYLVDYGSGNHCVLYEAASKISLSDGGVLTGPTVTNGLDTIVDALCNGASSSLTLNGGTPVVGDAGSVDPDATGIQIGGFRASYLTGWVGRIYEVIVCSSALSAGNRASLIKYFKNRYSIP